MGDDRFMGQGMRRRQGGRPSNYGNEWYPPGRAINRQGPAVPCPEFNPAEGDPGGCTNCGAYDGDHSYEAMGPWASNYAAEVEREWPRGIPGSDSSTGAH